MLKGLGVLGLFLLGGFLLFSDPSISAQGTSNSYRIDESFIGPGGNLDSNSSNFSIDTGRSSVGNAGGTGESSSTTFNAQSGATTTNDPRLSCVLNTGSLSFGGLSQSATATATATFSVLNYTSYGYNVSILGGTITNGAYSISAMNINDSSQVGTEQFGINLKANTIPGVGADPVQNPSGSFSFGQAATNYNTANSFRFVAGETIATAPKSSGQTDYTISYIVNAAVTTPGGKYTGSQTILCTGTY